MQAIPITDPRPLPDMSLIFLAFQTCSTSYRNQDYINITREKNGDLPEEEELKTMSFAHPGPKKCQ